MHDTAGHAYKQELNVTSWILAWGETECIGDSDGVIL